MTMTSQGDRDTERERNLETIGRSAYESIAEMVAALDVDYDRLEELADMETDDMSYDERAEWSDLLAAAGECTSREDAEQRIQEDPLSVLVRSGWYEPGRPGEEFTSKEYEILLSTGGPATRIRGELDSFGEPDTAHLEAQDWFTPWTEYHGHSVSDTEREPVDPDVLLTYARQFYFGA
jgi:hypothetical protein